MWVFESCSLFSVNRGIIASSIGKGPGEKRNEFVSRIIKQQLEFIQTKFSVEIKYQTFVEEDRFPYTKYW